ncbi:ABC transporter ATP-binding protein [Clostridium tagluense]|uniref:ABC transporter ATP-binding protein n=1 Tax=Clostridium tagluense TaxID=360422 RepID=UPI001C6ED3F5|nr:ATP-binding cassette domain-containing protein [Clostridium tagluense]MBW9156847.1 ATP-binding cassette domain-containing protein [Clostridium tagluense]WLC66327.1 ATP-binding cassette domain-containing protein [Clostridium tagluense]
MISLSHINKDYRIAKREPGLKSAAKALFHKEYHIVHALQDISLNIKDGEMVGYIGPNGAGKSSTIKIMSGVLRPDSGSCIINGRIPWKDRVNHVKEIGVVFGQRSQLWWDVPVGDSFLLLKELYHIDTNKYNKRVNELSELINIGDLLKVPARQLSLGQRMKCELGASLLHNPKILFLDEPTIGLDAVSKIAVRNFISEINKEYKTTIILTTHDMQDIEAMTNRIIFIGKGKILLDGTMDMLKKKYSKNKRIEVYYKGEISLKLSQEENKLELDGIQILEHVQGKVIITVDTEVTSISHTISFLCSRLEVIDISITGTSAEEIVLSLYEEYAV